MEMIIFLIQSMIFVSIDCILGMYGCKKKKTAAIYGVFAAENSVVLC